MSYHPIMKPFRWETAKNERLKAARGIGFEDAVDGIARGNLLDVVDHTDPAKYSGQKIFIIKIRNYAFLVPFRETDDEIILITVIPSRKATREYLGGSHEKT